MLQWMGGSRRKVTTSRKSTEKRQKQYFEQRKRQQQQQHNSSGLESYSDNQVPCRPCHENNRSLDVLSLLNLSNNGQDLTSRFPEASGSLKGEYSTPNYEIAHGPNTIQVETKNLCPSEHVGIREKSCSSVLSESLIKQFVPGMAPNDLEETVCPQEFVFDFSSSSHLDASKRNDDKEPKTMSTDHIDHKLSVVDMLGDDGQNSISRGSLVHEEHVAFSVEGLGRVEMETPVHSPQQPTRNFSYGCATPSKMSKGCHSSKKLNFSLEDQFPELDKMAVDASSTELPPYLGELYGNSKPKIMVGKESLKDFLSNGEFYDSRVEQDRYQWHEKPSFFGDKYLDDTCGLSWKNWPSDLGSSMANHMKSRKCDKPDFSFEGLPTQKRRGGSREAGSFNISELSSPYKHQREHGYDFTTSDITRYPTIGSYCEFSEMARSSAWPSFATEDARDCLSLSSEDSCLSHTVWPDGTKNLSFNSSERRKIRGDEADSRSPFNKFSTKKNTFTQEFCTKRINTWQHESVICSDFSTPGDNWLFGDRCNIENVKLSYANMNASETQKASSPFGCKRWTEDPFESGFNPECNIENVKLSYANMNTSETQKISPFGCKSWTEDPFESGFNPELYVDDKPSASRSKHQELFDGCFKEEKDSPKIQLSVSKGENKSITLPTISSMLDQHEENCNQRNYSSSTNGRPINFLDSEDNQSHSEESKVKTPEIAPGPNAVLSPVCSEGGSSSVEMPQKLEDCEALKENRGLNT